MGKLPEWARLKEEENTREERTSASKRRRQGGEPGTAGRKRDEDLLPASLVAQSEPLFAATGLLCGLRPM
jgi:hypothetical protein